jgi:hypothetical protein
MEAAGGSVEGGYGEGKGEEAVEWVAAAPSWRSVGGGGSRGGGSRGGAGDGLHGAAREEGGWRLKEVPTGGPHLSATA